jgi:hypothetical protein
MLTKRISLWIVILGALGFCQYSGAQETPIVKLSSVEECEQKYWRTSVTKKVNGIECFYGKRMDLSEKYDLPAELLKFDTTRLEVTPLLSKEDHDKHFKTGVGDLAIDPMGRWVAAMAPVLPETGSLYFDILLIDLQGGQYKILVSDQQRNYGLSCSPDGRFIAYFSTDPAMAKEPEKIHAHMAGRLVEVATGKVTSYTSHFMDKGQWTFGNKPIWLDNNRVLYRTFTTDQEVINASGADPAVKKYPYVAIAYPATDKVQGLLIPDGLMPPRAFVDQKNKCIYLANYYHLVLKTDFDLANQTTVLEVKEPQRIRVLGLKEDGSLDYWIKKQ